MSSGPGGQSLVGGLFLQVQSIAGCWCNWLVDLHVMLRRSGWISIHQQPTGLGTLLPRELSGLWLEVDVKVGSPVPR